MPILFQDKKTSLSKFKIGVPKSDQSLPAPLKKNITETVERRQELIRSGNNHSSIRYTFFVSLDFNLFVNIKQNYLLEKLFEFTQFTDLNVRNIYLLILSLFLVIDCLEVKRESSLHFLNQWKKMQKFKWYWNVIGFLL